MAVEAKRGCGYRKIGGTYLVGGGIGVPCDRLPLALDVCPCCGQGIKQGMGWTWVDVAKLVQGPHVGLYESERSRIFDLKIPCPETEKCLFCGNPEAMGRAGLLWVGERFYKTPEAFIAEGVQMGFSKRIKAVPRGFKVGETYVLLAHPKAVPAGPIQSSSHELVLTTDEARDKGKPGIFYIWKPQRVERIFPESMRGSEKVKADEERGVTAVFVPDGDKDHRGTVYDKPEDDNLD